MFDCVHDLHKRLVFYPMKPGPCVLLPASISKWVVEPKYDGWHVVIVLQEGTIGIYSRNLKMNMTNWPGLNSIRSVLTSEIRSNLVLVGEVLAPSGISTDVMRARNKGPQLEPRFFDLISEKSIGLPLFKRRKMLLALGLPKVWYAEQEPVKDKNYLAQVFKACKMKKGVEGIVIKDPNSFYETSTVSPVVAYSWLKIK